MARRRTNINEYTRAVLLALHDAAFNHRGDFISIDDLLAYVPSCGGQIIMVCLSDLESGGFVHGVHRDGRYLYCISKKGFELIDGWGDEEYSSVDELRRGDLSAANMVAEGSVEVPASDRLVTLNHNQSDYQQAVEALDRVLEEFRNDHRLDNELGPLKDAQLKVLEGGRKALEDKEISAENGQDWIVKPLKWIVEKFADGALKVLALKALEAIAKLF